PCCASVASNPAKFPALAGRAGAKSRSEGGFMANGASALQLVQPVSQAAGGLEKIGVAVADAMAAISRGVWEWGFSGDGLTHATKMLGVDKIADLYWISRSPGFDFAVARSEGRRVMLARLGADANARALDIILDGTFEILDKVITFMDATEPRQ